VDTSLGVLSFLDKITWIDITQLFCGWSFIKNVGLSNYFVVYIPEEWFNTDTCTEVFSNDNDGF